jgi:HSP20 family protein
MEDHTMVYRTTLTPLVSLRREMDRLFDDPFFGRTGQAPARSAWSPAVDVREEEQAWVFELDLPGVEPAQVEVTADDGVLTVRGERGAARQEGEAGRWHLVERLRGSFQRRFTLPENIAEDGIEATFAHGVLTIRAPKTAVPQPRRIEIKG